MAQANQMIMEAWADNLGKAEPYAGLWTGAAAWPMPPIRCNG